MLPHAGYVFCGTVIGATWAASWGNVQCTRPLPRRLLILCPNHTGMGHPLGVWPEGFWRTPLGDVAVDADMAQTLCQRAAGFTPDTDCHLHEHAIEVLLPFLQYLTQEDAQALRITPICVGTADTAVLRSAGLWLAEVLRQRAAAGETVGIIVSSDMNHYEDVTTTARKDAHALAMAMACDGNGLLLVTQREHITMCGAAPLALTLFAAQASGTPWAELCYHDTSATASGDTKHVVGYAGLRFGWA